MVDIRLFILILFFIQPYEIKGASIGFDTQKEGFSKLEIQPKLMVFESPSDVSVFYSVESNQTIKNMAPRPWITPKQALRLPFIGDPCSCDGYQCGCCAGIRIPLVNFDRHICANVSYEPHLFGLVLDVSVDNTSVLHNVVSAKNPPPICWPVPLGPIPGVTMCIKFYDIYLVNTTNVHVCMDWEISVISFPVLVLQFDCVNVGSGGVSFVKPDENFIENQTSSSNINEGQTGDYDEVTEIKTIVTTEDPYDNLVLDYEDDYEAMSNFDSKKIVI